LDACWIYNVQGNLDNSPAPEFSPGAAVSYGPTFDAPAYALGTDGMRQLSVDDTFTDYFMFEPDAPSWHHHVWVNFGKLVWSWGGVATAGIPSWVLSGVIAPGPTLYGSANSDPVAWPSIYTAMGSIMSKPAGNPKIEEPR
jgi:hypothetical protein